MPDRISYPATWGPTARKALDDLFDRARQDGLWFYHGGLAGQLWFSPDELQSEQTAGSFVWGAANWSLRHPQERITQIDEQIAGLVTERAAIKQTSSL